MKSALPLVCSAALGALACAAEDPAQPAHDPMSMPVDAPAEGAAPDATDTDEPRSGDLPRGFAGSTAPLPVDGAGPLIPDRCLRGSCAPPVLPPQPELAFLQDMGDGWQRLLEIDWEVGANSEGYRCATFTVPRDVHITEFAPQVPLGTHHLTYGVSSVPSGPDRVFTCNVGDIGDRHLQGGGIGSEPIVLPPGVAMPLESGSQIYMNLHLFNFADETLRGRSGMWVKTVASAAVEHEAESLAAGPLMLDIPIGRSTRGGTCTIRGDATIYMVSPHMHQTGVHMLATTTGADGEREIFDSEYDFNHQLAYDVGPFEVKRGDRVDVECTYENDTDSPLRWGDSALDEMCFVVLSFYPAYGYGSNPCSS
jgi:hypothetical protein